MSVSGLDVFGDFPYKGMPLRVKGSKPDDEPFVAEDWARNVMKEGIGWPSDMGNPSVIVFWTKRVDKLLADKDNAVEGARIALSGIYGHIGWSGCIMLPEELELGEIEVEQ